MDPGSKSCTSSQKSRARLPTHLWRVPTHLPSIMFRRFTVAEDITTTTSIKSSAIRGIKSTIEAQFPGCADYMDVMIPKKATVLEGKGCVGWLRVAPLAVRAWRYS